MRAVLFHGEGKVSVGEVDPPVLRPGEALVRVTRAALCGSELAGFRGRREKPGGTGHEAVGVIADPGDTSLRAGTRVAVHAVIGCGTCESCRGGRFPHCLKPGVMPASHAEFLPMPERNLLPLPDELDDDTAIALYGCGIGVAYHGCRRIEASAGESVLVAGAGPIGLSAVLVLRHLGARPIVADVNDYRLGLASTLGAVATLNSAREQGPDAVAAANGGRLADKAFLASGNPDACLLAIQGIGPEGKVAAVGGVHGFPLDTFGHLAVRDRSLVGSWHFHLDEVEPLRRLTEEGLPAASIITHRFPVEEAPEAYRRFVAGETGKALLDFGASA